MPEATGYDQQPAVFGMVVQTGPDRGVNTYWSSFVAGLEEALDREGAQVLLRTAVSVDEELQTLDQWSAGKIVAAVVLGDLHEDDSRAARCAELGLPAVLHAGTPLPGQAVIEMDQGAAMHQAIDFLAGLGHRRIGRISGPTNLRHIAVREREFTHRIEHHGIAGVSRAGDYGARSGAACTIDLLGLESPPTAIVYDNDAMAVAGLAAAIEHGLEVPTDLSILAWDDSPASRLADPPLSVVRHDVHALGAVTARALVELHAGVPSRLRHAPPPGVIERGSTAPPRPATHR